MLDGLVWIIIALLLGKLTPVFNRLHLDTAATTILLGLLVGPLLLNLVEMSAVGRIFTEAALIIMLFAAGYEIQWKYFLKAIKPGLLVGISGILLSFSIGFVAVFILNKRLDEALYVATALAATSIGLSIPLFSRQGLLQKRIGQILLAAAIVDDLIALYLLSVVHLALTSSNGFISILLDMLGGLVILLLIAGGGWVINWLVHLPGFTCLASMRRLLFYLVAFIAAIATHEHGMSTAIGSFFAGAVLALYKAPDKKMDIPFFNQASEYMAPIFFLGIGIQIYQLEISSMHLILLSLMIMVIAIVGKLLCPWIIYKQINIAERWALGWALVPRGEVALIVASVGFQQGHLSQHAMVALVLMALVTALLPAIAIPRIVARNRDSLNEHSV